MLPKSVLEIMTKSQQQCRETEKILVVKVEPTGHSNKPNVIGFSIVLPVGPIVFRNSAQFIDKQVI